MDGKDFRDYYTKKTPMPDQSKTKDLATQILKERERKSIVSDTKASIFFTFLSDFIQYSEKVWKSLRRRGNYGRSDFNIYHSTAASYYKGLTISASEEDERFLRKIYSILHREDFNSLDSDLPKIIKLSKNYYNENVNDEDYYD